jgi:hypothetical protein
MRRSALTWALASILALAGCDQLGTEQEETFVVAPVAFTNFEDVESLTRGNTGVAVLRDQAALDEFFEDHSPEDDPAAAPAFDFDRQMLLAVFWGTGYSGCANRVEAIETVLLRTFFDGRNPQLEVRVGPLPDLGPCDAEVFPIQIVAVEPNDETVLFGGDVPD